LAGVFGGDAEKKKSISRGVVILSQGLPCAPQANNKLALRVTYKRPFELSPGKIAPKVIYQATRVGASDRAIVTDQSHCSFFLPLFFFFFGKREL